MGFFDQYVPARSLACPECGTPLMNWQGKDGACGLFVWEEGKAAPTDQLAPPELQMDLALRLGKRLPARFRIYSHDCVAHEPIMADCAAPDGTWNATTLRPFVKPRR